MPGWAQLPPPAPLLPPVPFVVSRSFSKDLATWRAPQLQVGPLGHGVSDLAPEGTIAAVAVLDPEPLVRLDEPSAGAPGNLTLPVLRHGTGETDDVPGQTMQTTWSFRSPAGNPEIGVSESAGTQLREPDPAVSTVPAVGGVPQMPLAAAPGRDSTPRERATSASPATPTGAEHPSGPPAAGRPESEPPVRAAAAASTPLSTAASAPVARPLVEATVPAQLPLIQLKTAPVPLPAGSPAEPLDSRTAPGPVQSEPPLTVAPLIGDRRPAHETEGPGYPTASDTDVAAADRATGDAARGEQPLNLAQPAGRSETDGPEATPAVSTGAEPPRRSGLGAPLRDLPPTAAALDASSLAAAYARRPRNPSGKPGAQMPLAAAMAARLQEAGGAGPDSPAGRWPSVVAEPVPTYGETSSLPLVTPEPESHGPAEGVTSSSLPPAPMATVALTPFQSMDGPRRDKGTAGTERDGAALKAVIGLRHGVNLDDVTIDRSPASAAKAQSVGADALTSEHTVVIPKSFGTLDAGAGRALLAHELTHAAQQRKAGPRALPPEHSPAGRTMEAAAVATELSYLPAASLMPGVGTPPPPAPGVAFSPSSGKAPSAAPASGSPPLALARPEPQSIDDGALTAALMRLGAVTGNAAASMAGSPIAATQSAVAAGSTSPAAAAPAPAPTAAPVQHAWKVASPTAQKPVIGAQRSVDSSPFSSRPSDKDLANLASWLYPLISFKMRRELKTDRERAGLLTDLHRR